MGLLLRMFNRAYRLARAAEGAGDYRRAATLYVEADRPEDAANALLFHAARASTLEERLGAYGDALRWLPEGHPRAADVHAQIGLAILDDAQRRGARSAEEKRRLQDAAERLERSRRWSDAATAWELLGRDEAMARCLEKAGDIDRLERLLNATSAEEDRKRRLRRLVSDYEMALSHGARLEARAALREAATVAPDDAAIADMLRQLEKRFPAPHRVHLIVDGEPVTFVGLLPATLGRVGADVSLRGASVSRRHAEIALGEGGLIVRDLGSRNGTLVRGLPIAGAVTLRGETEIGLGDDVSVLITAGEGDGVLLEVVRGLDRGTRVVAGRGRLRLGGLPATVTFAEGHAVLAPDAGMTLALGPQRCAMPVVLLAGDHLTLGAHVIEVRA